MKTVEYFLKTALKRKITMLTAYDYQMAQIEEAANIDAILVGDSLAMVFQGLDTTQKVSLEQMAYHISAVSRGAPNTMIVGDLPYKTYETPEQAVESAKTFIRAGADTVKLEGCNVSVIEAITKAGIPVMAHLGLLPQTAESFTVQGKKKQHADLILEHAKKVTKAGAYAVVLECIPESLAIKISKSISIPTIGIGAGIHCGGQILVVNDLLGMGTKKVPKFINKYAHLNQTIYNAISTFVKDVTDKRFPTNKHTYH